MKNIVHKEFTLETLNRENQQTKEIYHSYSDYNNEFKLQYLNLTFTIL